MTLKSDRRHLASLLTIVVAFFVVLSALAPSTYPTFANLASMGFQMSEIGILALAIGIAFLAGGLDLSVVSVANMSAITAAYVTTALEPSLGTAGSVVVAVGASLLVGLLAGLLNGMLVSRLRVHPIVITLGTMTLFIGVATGITGGSTVFGTGALTGFGRSLVAGVPIPFVVFAILAVGLGLVTTRSRWGFTVYMVGASEQVSRYSRLAVERVQLSTYLLSGLLAAVAGLIILARTNAANVSFGSSYLILAILVAVLAGISPYGGKGRIALIVLSMAAMQQLSTGLNMVLAGWDGANFAREFAWGVLLIAALGWTQLGVSTRIRNRIDRMRRGPTQPAADGETAATGDEGAEEGGRADGADAQRHQERT